MKLKIENEINIKDFIKQLQKISKEHPTAIVKILNWQHDGMFKSTSQKENPTYVELDETKNTVTIDHNV